MRMRDWELLASPYQFDSKQWFISFYKERGLDEQRLIDVFNVPKYSSGCLDEMILEYVELNPDLESRAFARDFWDNSQDAIEEYCRMRSHPLFELHWTLWQSIDWIKSWGNCFQLRSQDLSEKEDVLFYRRYWLNVYRERYEEDRSWRSLLGLRFEIIIPSKLGLGIRFTVGGEDQLQIGIRAWKLGACWFTITQLLPNEWLPREERETGICLFEDHLSFSFWRDDCGWGKSWRGFYKGVFLMDLLFGGTEYEKTPVAQKKIEVYFPEGTYEGTAETYLAAWTRPRAFWWKKQSHRVELKFPQGIPIPGKGENGYDLEDDASFGVTMSADTIEEAAQEFIKDIQQARIKYGGSQWYPQRRIS